MKPTEKLDYDRPFKAASLRIEQQQVTIFFLLLLCLSWPYMVLTADYGDSPARMLPLILVGPSVSAFIVAYAARGTAGVKELGGMLCRAKAPRFTYLLIFVGLPTCFLGAAYAVAGIWYPDQVAAPSTNSIVSAIANFGIIFVFAGLGEEFGWRGLALARLQERRGPMTASLFVGLMWSVWHFPLSYGSDQWLVGNVILLISVTAAAFFYTWIFNRTGGSIVIIALLHTTENSLGWPYQDAFSFEPPGFLFFDGVKAGVWVVIAVIVVVLSRKALAHQSQQRTLRH